MLVIAVTSIRLPPVVVVLDGQVNEHYEKSTPWGRRGRIPPQHPLACRKRRLNGAAYLPWAATRVAWGKDPGGWGLELTVLSSGSNTPLWPLLVLDGRLNLVRCNQSAGRAEPKDEWLWKVISRYVCHRPEYLNCQHNNHIYIFRYIWLVLKAAAWVNRVL